jgi:hypothetical protein
MLFPVGTKNPKYSEMRPGKMRPGNACALFAQSLRLIGRLG